MPLEAFSLGVEKRSCKSFELKDFSVCNTSFCTVYNLTDPLKTWHSKSAFFGLGLNALILTAFFCRNLIQSAGSVKSGKSSGVRSFSWRKYKTPLSDERGLSYHNLPEYKDTFEPQNKTHRLI